MLNWTRTYATKRSGIIGALKVGNWQDNSVASRRLPPRRIIDGKSERPRTEGLKRCCQAGVVSKMQRVGKKCLEKGVEKFHQKWSTVDLDCVVLRWKVIPDDVGWTFPGTNCQHVRIWDQLLSFAPDKNDGLISGIDCNECTWAGSNTWDTFLLVSAWVSFHCKPWPNYSKR